MINIVNWWDDGGVLKLHFNHQASARMLLFSDMPAVAWPMWRRAAVASLKAACQSEGATPVAWQATCSPDGAVLAYAVQVELGAPND